MKQTEVKQGACYVITHHGGSKTIVRVVDVETRVVSIGDPRMRAARKMTRYRAVNLATGRAVVIKSAVKLRKEAGPEDFQALGIAI